MTATIPEIVTPEHKSIPRARANTRGAKVLILDIERMKGRAEVEFWDLGDYKNRRLHADTVVEWPRNICLAWRWYGDKRVQFAAEWEPGGSQRMHETAWGLYDEADIVVGHNIDGFDTKKLTATWLSMGLTPPRPYKSVDTLKVARRAFSFESNTLDALCTRLGIPAKVDRYDVEVARAACAGHKPSQRRLKRYNAGDVECTEWLLDTLRPWISNHPFMGTLGDEKVCNRCGSTDLKLLPTTYRAQVIDYALYRCEGCKGHVKGGWHSRAANTRGV